MKWDVDNLGYQDRTSGAVCGQDPKSVKMINYSKINNQVGINSLCNMSTAKVISKIKVNQD